ncbi:MAG TPA: beta-1,6-N-acetylglucosaminyltransferase [Rhizomicrobium sp.]|jgi:hypothetical protein
MIAYFLLVHRYPEQFKRLFRAIHDPKNLYLIHIDKNSGPELDANIRDFLSAYPNAAILKSERALWGGYSLVDAALRGMAELLRMSPDWDYFVNLSGQDFPLKSQSEIAQFLAENRGTEFIRTLNQQTDRPETMSRVRRYAVESADGIVQTDVSRPFLEGATPYIGNQWMVVSRRFCRFVTQDAQADRYKAFYKNTFIADEGFFQTVMMNTSEHGLIYNDDLRAIDWVPDGIIKLRPRTFTIADAPMLTASPALFARKFDESTDSEIFTALEHHIGRAKRPPLEPRRGSAAQPKTLVAA